MDYDSAEEGEEDEGDEEGGNKDEEELDEAGVEEEEEAPGALEESKSRKSRRSQVVIQNQDQSRVNMVLQSNAAVESYCYDVEHELWCEVSHRISDPVSAPQLNWTVGSWVYRILCGYGDGNSSTVKN